MSVHDEQERQEWESEERQMDAETFAALQTRQELTDSEAEARIQQREEEEEYGRYQELDGDRVVRRGLLRFRRLTKTKTKG